jgi:3-methyl-2-oxobutanoate hydroxymethyltransferase
MLPIHHSVTVSSRTFCRRAVASIGLQHDVDLPSKSTIARTIGSRYFATKISALSLTAKKRKGKKITVVTAYDYPSAIHVARAGIDIVLVGDSVAMVELGHETTQCVSVDGMIHHCQSVKRGLEVAKSTSMLVGDMPFGSYEFEDTDVALRNAYRFVKEAGCDAVKVEVRGPSSLSWLTTMDLHHKILYL